MLTRLIYSLMVLVLTAAACATPTTPEAIVETAVPPTHTPQPTATTAPTVTPQPTPTPTAEEQANQLLLADGRFTTLLAELTQEIGRGLSHAEQAQVLALARALWLPGQLDESDWLPDPAGVTLHWRPALDGREGPVVRVVEAQPDSPYAVGAVIFWQAERLLTLTPTQPGFNIEYAAINKNGRSLSTWIETDANGELIRFVDNTSPPDSPTYLKWVVPQDLGEDGSFSLFIVQDTDPNNGSAQEFWWTNGGEPIQITTAPDGRTLTDYLAANPGHTLSEQDGQLVLTDGDTILFTLKPDTNSWEQALQLEFVAGFAVADGKVYREGRNGPEIHGELMEAMDRGGLEPIDVWQDPDTETTYFKVFYEGQELSAELKDRHAGIGRALIVRDVFVSEPNPNMPPPRNLRVWNQDLGQGYHTAVVDNPQLTEVRLDWVVFVNPPVHISQKGYWQAAFEFRGNTSEGLTYFTVPYRVGFGSATGPFFEITSQSLEREFGPGGSLEIGDVWRNIKIIYSVNSGYSRDFFLSRLTSQTFSGGKAEFRLGAFGTGASNPTTFEDVIEAVLSGKLSENDFFADFVTLPPGK
jgi:hypothetical protein